jgi:hypothetical protein
MYQTRTVLQLLSDVHYLERHTQNKAPCFDNIDPVLLQYITIAIHCSVTSTSVLYE